MKIEKHKSIILDVLSGYGIPFSDMHYEYENTLLVFIDDLNKKCLCKDFTYMGYRVTFDDDGKWFLRYDGKLIYTFYNQLNLPKSVDSYDEINNSIVDNDLSNKVEKIMRIIYPRGIKPENYYKFIYTYKILNQLVDMSFGLPGSCIEEQLNKISRYSIIEIKRNSQDNYHVCL